MKAGTIAFFLLITFLCASTESRAQYIPDGVLAYYPLDGTAKDASGNANHGTVNQFKVVRDRFNNPGGASNSGAIYIPTFDLRPENQLSIQIWFRTDITTIIHSHGLIYQGGINNRSPQWRIDFRNEGAKIAFGLATTTGYEELVTDLRPELYSGNAWHLLVATFDGNRQKIYLDNEKVGELPREGRIVFADGVARIGAGSSAFLGFIDDVCLYRRALNEAEISTLWNFNDYDKHFSTKVSGRVFADLNGTCAEDAGDAFLPNTMIKILPGPFFSWSLPDGRFAIRLPAGDYTVEPVVNDRWHAECPGEEQYSVSLDEDNPLADNLSFALQASHYAQELEVSLVGTPLRPGFSGSYVLYYHNSGTLPFTGRVFFRPDPWLSLGSAEPAADTYSSGVASWQLVNLPIGAYGRINLNVTLDRETPLGIEICSQSWMERDNPDIELLSGTEDEYCDLVRGSYDPNDIAVSPAGALYKNDTTLSYTIRFQNTGTAPAARVVVIDTLPQGLDLESLRIGAVSHDYQFSISEGTIARWTFDGIELPDSHANEAASHGYIRYRVNRYPDLPIGTRLANSAAIYFDYNDPVITNTVVNILSHHPTAVEPGSGAPAISVFPNPAGESLQVQSDEAFSGKLVLRDMLGRRVLMQPARSAKAVVLDVSALPESLYFLQIDTERGTFRQRVVIRR